MHWRPTDPKRPYDVESGWASRAGAEGARLNDANDAYTRAMSDLLSPIEMRMLEFRVDRLLTDGSFPQPGAGPNRPWPAV